MSLISEQGGRWPIWMAPLTRSRAIQPGNLPGAMQAEYYAQRADPSDGAVVIISEATPICPEGHGYFATPGIHQRDQVQGWKQVTDKVHRVGGQIICQLWHVGRVSHRSLQPENQDPVSSTEQPAKSKTYIDAQGNRAPCSTPRSLSSEEIPQLVESFRRAASNAMEAGFDGVEIHGANGYLLEQFLRSGINDRTDQYGGSLENRLRFCLEVTAAVIGVWGEEKVGYRVSPISGDLAGDRGDENMLETYGTLAEQLALLKIAFLDVVESFSVGQREPGLAEICQRMRKSFSGGPAGLYLAGGGYTRESARDALDSGRCDGVIFGRDFISNPDLRRRLREDLPLTPWNRRSFYLGGEEGYTDWPLA